MSRSPISRSNNARVVVFTEELKKALLEYMRNRLRIQQLRLELWRRDGLMRGDA
jgi:hypothetical protein